LGVEWKYALEPLDQVGEDERDGTERQQRSRVLRPPLLDIRPHAPYRVSQSLKWIKNRVQEGPLALKDTRHEHANGFRQNKQDHEIGSDLKKT
jgi:hypothetical protein